MKIKIIFFGTLLCAFFILKASAQEGRILVEEHFVGNSRGWTVGEDNDFVRTMKDGRLTLECKKLEKGGGCSIKLPDFKLPAGNYSISFTTRWVKNLKKENTYSPYGIIVGAYYFLAYGDGDRRLLRYNGFDGKYETIVDWGVQSAIHKRGSEDNKWEIQYKDGKAAYYANGNLLYKKEFNIPEEAAVKLFVDKSEMVEFDDLVVKSL